MTPATSAQPAAVTSAPTGAPSGGPKRVSNIEVMIPAFNEEINLPHALRSVVGWADRVFVVDSQSTDKTRQIAERMGATVVVQPWLGYAKQKNWALANLPMTADWVFILDADESITPELRDELLAIASRPAAGIAEAGFYCNRLTYFMGKPIRHCGYYPSYNLRFFKRGRARYEEREVHEHMEVDGSTARLDHIMLHEDRRGLEHFIAKHNRYSTLESRELTRERMLAKTDQAADLERGIAARRWLKRNVLPRLPLAGVWRFIYMYIFRLGFLDGVTGFRFSLFLASYDFFISLKLAEMRTLQARLDAEGLLVKDSPTGLAQPEGTLAPLSPAELAMRPRPMEVGKAAPSTEPPAGRAVPHVPAPVAPTPTLDWQPHAGPEEAERARVPRRGLMDRLAPTGHWTFTPADLPHTARPLVSVIILAFNEEDNIGPCLDSCAWCDDVHVLDSGSTDRTREIAERWGAKVHINQFKSFGDQRNWAIDNIPAKHRWQFQLDADERFSPAVVNEMAERVSGHGSVDGVTAYQNPSMMMFMERWLRHAAEYPVYQVRLFDKEVCRFEDYGHGQREVNPGRTGVMVQPYLHYNFSKGLEEWLDKHNRYSKLEAEQALARRAGGAGALLAGLIGGGTVQRRRVLKSLSYRIPLRTTLIMLYQMVLRLGFLDGSAGWNYVRLRAIYETMISVKMSVLKNQRPGLPPPPSDRDTPDEQR